MTTTFQVSPQTLVSVKRRAPAAFHSDFGDVVAVVVDRDDGALGDVVDDEREEEQLSTV